MLIQEIEYGGELSGSTREVNATQPLLLTPVYNERILTEHDWSTGSNNINNCFCLCNSFSLNIFQMNESRSVFAPGFKPVPLTEQELAEWGEELGVKLCYGHRAHKLNYVQLRTPARFIEYNKLSWFAKMHDLEITNIYSIEGETDHARIQINFYNGWINPFE